MLTKSQAPWVEYLEIDEETGARKLKDDAPEEIKKAYMEHLLKFQRTENEKRPK